MCLIFQYPITIQLTARQQLYHSPRLSHIKDCYAHILWLLNHPSDSRDIASEKINIPLIAHCFVSVLLLGTMPARYQNSVVNWMAAIRAQRTPCLKKEKKKRTKKNLHTYITK